MKEVQMDKLPKCDFCYKMARYDAKTIEGCWAYMCEEHWNEHAASKDLGLGIGQKLTH